MCEENMFKEEKTDTTAVEEKDVTIDNGAVLDRTKTRKYDGKGYMRLGSFIHSTTIFLFL